MKTHTIYAAVILAVVVGAVIFARSWADHVRDDAGRDATVKQKAEEISQSQAQITALQKQTAESLAAKDAEIAKVRQDADAARAVLLQAYAVAQKPAPHQVTAAEATAISKAPDAPSVKAGDLILDSEQQQDAAEFKLGCDKCFASLAEVRAENEQQRAIIAAKDAQLQASAKASKGGSTFKRTYRTVRDAACGAAGAGVGSVAAGPKGAMIGAAGAAILCHVVGR
jgi:hypothetical protein